MPIAPEKDLDPGLFSLSRTLNFHLELTDKCTAGCPMCGRTVQMDRCRPDFEKVRNIELSLDVIRRNFPPDFCRRVDTIDLCGGLGDPPAARECLEICKYFIDNGIKLILSSNGGLRSEDWWRKLGNIFSSNSSFVEFHIDGLADTNHLYRINTRFSKIMANARAFLGTGAIGEWHFIPFKHNQHQLAEALSLSRKMGFRSFQVIDTIRFGPSKSFVYQMPDGSIRHLEPSSGDIVSLAPGKKCFTAGNESSRFSSHAANRLMRIGRTLSPMVAYRHAAGSKVPMTKNICTQGQSSATKSTILTDDYCRRFFWRSPTVVSIHRPGKKDAIQFVSANAA